MAPIRVVAERRIAAPAELVYGQIADMHQHQAFLPPAFSDFRVEAGGIGAGSVVSFDVTAGGRSRHYRMVVAEPKPGEVLTESDSTSSLVTTFTVRPEGDACHVRIETRWEGAGGIGGFFERLFAPAAMRRLYDDELRRLDAHASGRR